MSSEYEVSVRLMLWGERVDLRRLIDNLGLDDAHVRRDSNRSDRKGKTSKVDTAAFEYRCDAQYPEFCRDPESQFSLFEEKLKDLRDSEFAECGVEYSELQMFVYYQERIDGKSDFYVSIGLLNMLQKHSIRLRITILP